MDVLQAMIQALWQQDFTALSEPNVIGVIYSIMFATLLLENGLLPAAFLPGDSLLLLAGAMVAKGVMSFIPTLLILTVAASLGCWLSYLQGRWLGNTRLVKGWMQQLPEQYHQRASNLFHRHGLLAILIGRFLAFVRTILPVIAGLSGLKGTRFHLFNWFSGVLWVGILTGLGYAISLVPFIKRHEDQVMTGLMILPVIMVVVGLSGIATFLFRRYRARQSQTAK